MLNAIKNRVIAGRRRRIHAKLVAEASRVDTFLVSYPKCGRTWLRFVLSHYLAAHAELGFVPDLASQFRVLPNFDLIKDRGLPFFVGKTDRLPLVAVSHRNFASDLFLNKPALLMVRDPRDVTVSAYFHQTRQKKRFTGDVGEFIEDPKLGVPSLIAYLNGWAGELGNRRHHVLSYERMTADTENEVAAALSFIGVIPDPALVRAAIDAGNFGKMRKMEIETGIPGHEYDRSDEQALRARKGKVGGWRDTLTEAQGERVMELCRKGLTPAARAMLAAAGLEVDPPAPAAAVSAGLPSPQPVAPLP